MTRLLAVVTLCVTVCVLALPIWSLSAAPGLAQGPLRIEITQGVVEPLPYAVPDFYAESPAAGDVAQQIARVVASDLTGTGLFREVPRDAHISGLGRFGDPVAFADWRAINAQALIAGAVDVQDGRLTVKFRVFDSFAGAEIGSGLQLAGTPEGWRRMAHKVADIVYTRLTGEAAYFDSRVVFVAESGPKDSRRKRLALMDYDGANLQYLTDSSAIVFAPRFDPSGQQILYTSYATGVPRIHVLSTGDVASRVFDIQAGLMSYAPRFSPDGKIMVYSVTTGADTDIYAMDLASRKERRLTSSPAIETAPSFSPDGTQIVFESDRSGTQQLYLMPARGGRAQRISFGDGRYGTPVWSPRGDLIAFTKQNNGRFHIGVMRTDGSQERLLTASFLDEGPTWAPNGRVIMFTRESQGAGG
ncbi:MAG: Tol-Pal system beta propeller repeat protein TolB, partial [Primorskyibacter sp.]